MRSVLFVYHFVCLSVCHSVSRKRNEPISLKLGVMIATNNRKNLLIFAGDPVPDSDSGPLFHFRHHCGIQNFGRFICISHTVSFNRLFYSARLKHNSFT